MIDIKKANLLYRQGKYSTALEIYQAAKDEWGTEVFDWNIEDCERRISSKNDSCKLINSLFDQIYMVNMKKDVKKRIVGGSHLKKNGIDFRLQEAVNGYEGEAAKKYKEYSSRKLGDFSRFIDFQDLEIKRGKPFIESAGAIGYIYTYLNILREAKKAGYKKILILEDDIILHREFHRKFLDFYKKIGSDWKILQLGASQYGWGSVDCNKAILDGYYYPRRLDTCGSFAIAIDCSIYDELIEIQEAFESPFDHLALGEIYEKYLGKCYVCFPNIVMPDVASSSIRGGRDQKTHAEKMRWEMDNFDYPLMPPSFNLVLQDNSSLRYFSQFSKNFNRIVDLRLYIYTECGLRPIHNQNLFEKQNYELKSLPKSGLLLPKADYQGGFVKNQILCEDNVIKYLESIIFNEVDEKLIHGINFQDVPEVKGRVSVLVPTYKRPVNLKNALLSVISQDYLDKEIIVISDNDEGSSYEQETQAVIDELKGKYPDVAIAICKHKKNINGAAARNTGLLQSSGEFICFLDDDDEYLPDRLSKSIEKLKSSSRAVGAVYCGFLGWNSPKNDDGRYKEGNLTPELLLLDYKKHYLHTNTATYRRSALFAINGFDETYKRHQDLELNLRFFEKFKIEAVNYSGVRLNPLPSDVSNKVYNLEMLRLKEKFLSSFIHLINDFDKNTIFEIYKKHWSEVSRYMKGSSQDIVDEFYSNGPLNVYSMMNSQN